VRGELCLHDCTLWRPWPLIPEHFLQAKNGCGNRSGKSYSIRSSWRTMVPATECTAASVGVPAEELVEMGRRGLGARRPAGTGRNDARGPLSIGRAFLSFASYVTWDRLGAIFYKRIDRSVLGRCMCAMDLKPRKKMRWHHVFSIFTESQLLFHKLW
jgi:hypothetical protein